jgi:glycosyltransferase involved in cell wall biosynthesis
MNDPRQLAGSQRATIASNASARGLVESGATVDPQWLNATVEKIFEMADSGDSQAREIIANATARPKPAAEPKPIETSRRPRVGIVSPSMTLGGAEGWIRDMAVGPIDGFDVAGVAVTGPDVSRDRLDELTSVVPVALGPYSPGGLAELVDVLIVWGIRGFAGYLPDGLARPRLVAVSHGGGEWSEHLLADVDEWADYCVGVSQAAADAFPSPDVDVIWNGVDESRSRPSLVRGDVRRSWRVSQSSCVCLYVGRFSPEKSPEAVCHATKILGRGYRPVLVGGGWKDRETRDAARRADRRVVFPGVVDQPGDAMGAADCLVLASPSEGFSLAMIEAFHAGLPVASTVVGAVDEIEREFGPLVCRIEKIGDPQSTAAAIRLATSEIGCRRARRAREVASVHFTRDAMLKRWGDFLRRVVDV